MSGAAPPPLPSAWDSTSRGALTRFLHVAGSRARYTGQGVTDRDAAAVRSNHPIPANCALFYFEVEIISRGRDGFIGIGFATQEVKLDRLPGWEPHSYGYHGDDGHAFNGRGTGRAYGPTFGTGDWVGVIFNRVDRTISFTKRGYDLGVAFDNVPEDLLYPSVGFRTPDEEIVANFGNDLAAHPFKGDVEAIRSEATQRLYSRILAAPLPVASKCQASYIGELIFDYLKHHGHWDTAAAVSRDVLGGALQVQQGERDEAAAVHAVRDAVQRGDIDAAVALADASAPGALEAAPGLLFRLRCQKFMEMIKDGRDQDAMAYGREVLTPTCSTAADQSLLEDALALFAYEDPAASPSGRYLTPEHRADLAGAVCGAVLVRLGRAEVSRLEGMYRQAVAVHGTLVELEDPAAPLIDVPTLVLESAGDAGA